MGAELEKAKSFEERMKDRIREGIGDLLSDEEVKKLIDKGMEDVFLKPQTKPNPNGYGSPITTPCILNEVIKESLQPIVTQCVKDYIAEHKEEVLAEISKVLSNGVGHCVMSAINNVFQSSMINFQNQMIQNIQSMPRI